MRVNKNGKTRAQVQNFSGIIGGEIISTDTICVNGWCVDLSVVHDDMIIPVFLNEIYKLGKQAGQKIQADKIKEALMINDA